MNAPQKNGTAGIKSVIAVGSCKGGVGKSTVALNLAATLAKTQSVGLFDADVYGPSIPTLIKLENHDLYMENGYINPHTAHGIKLQSFGYTQTPDGKPANAILRGPMATQMVQQLLQGTQWGALDVLVIDMPPGTGDIPLCISQILSINTAILVSTPQLVSYSDVVRGAHFYQTASVPIAMLVENMSYLTLDTGQTTDVFGPSRVQEMATKLGVSNTATLPIDSEVSTLSDSGVPFCLEHPNAEFSRTMSKIASTVMTTLSPTPSFTLKYFPGSGVQLVINGHQNRTFSPQELRQQCGCAPCKKLPESFKQNLVPTAPKSIEALGNNASAVIWDDGHRSVYHLPSLT